MLLSETWVAGETFRWSSKNHIVLHLAHSLTTFLPENMLEGNVGQLCLWEEGEIRQLSQRRPSEICLYIVLPSTD